MKIAHTLMAFLLSVLLTGLIMGLATANVPGVALNAPPPPPAPNVATAGSDVTIKVTATHRDTGTPALHYVNRVALYDGDKLLKEWKYDQNSYKKDEVWTESYSGTVNSDMQLRAFAHCTEHGYEVTSALLRVLPAGTTPSQMMKTDIGSAGMQANGHADASKAPLSTQSSQLLQGIIKSQSSELKAFQGKLNDWMKSSEGQQFISQKEQTMASPTTRMMQAAGELGRQPANATKRANVSATPVATIKRSLAIYSGLVIPRTSVTATPTPLGLGRGNKTVSPKATLKASPTVKYLQARPPGATKASPTPVPGGYTPRFPGEPGYGKASPTPTVTPKATPMPTVKPIPAAGGTAGTAGTPMTDPSRYAARGPGIVDGTVAQPPAGAPGPMASPSPRPIKR